jgi:disulfide bond formation protein DsbB
MLYLLISFFVILSNLVALSFQVILHDLPCPLCLLQRIGFLSIGLIALLTIIAGKKYKPLLVLVTLVIFIIGVTQLLKHIVPPDPGYGMTFLTLHFYTWTAISTFCIIVALALENTLQPFFNSIFSWINIKKSVTFSRNVLFLLALINSLLVIKQCGYDSCHYKINIKTLIKKLST